MLEVSFNLENISDAECTAEFRFLKSDVYKLSEILQIPPLIKCYNRSVFDALVCFCVFLKQFPYPCCCGDMVPRFERPVPELCLMSNATLDHIYSRTVDLKVYYMTLMNHGWHLNWKLLPTKFIVKKPF